MDDVKDFMVGRDDGEFDCYFEDFLAERVEEEAAERKDAEARIQQQKRRGIHTQYYLVILLPIPVSTDA